MAIRNRGKVWLWAQLVAMELFCTAAAQAQAAVASTLPRQLIQDAESSRISLALLLRISPARDNVISSFSTAFLTSPRRRSSAKSVGDRLSGSPALS
jgi:hypothetical protein